MLSIRRARPDDADSIARVHVQAWEETYRGVLPDRAIDAYDLERRRTEWREDLDRGASVTFVACDAGTVVGFVSAYASRDEPGYDAYLSTLYVLRSHHRRGIALRLLGAALEVLRERGMRGLWLLTLRDRNPARAFYERIGATLLREQRAPAVLGEGVMDVVYGLGATNR